VEEALLCSRKDPKLLDTFREVCAKLSGLNEKFRKTIPDFDEEPRSREEEWRKLEKSLVDEKRDLEPLQGFCDIQSAKSGEFFLVV
jgi:hypothetical protein